MKRSFQLYLIISAIQAQQSFASDQLPSMSTPSLYSSNDLNDPSGNTDYSTYLNAQSQQYQGEIDSATNQLGAMVGDQALAQNTIKNLKKKIANQKIPLKKNNTKLSLNQALVKVVVLLLGLKYCISYIVKKVQESKNKKEALQKATREVQKNIPQIIQNSQQEIEAAINSDVIENEDLNEHNDALVKQSENQLHDIDELHNFYKNQLTQKDQKHRDTLEAVENNYQGQLAQKDQEHSNSIKALQNHYEKKLTEKDQDLINHKKYVSVLEDKLDQKDTNLIEHEKYISQLRDQYQDLLKQKEQEIKKLHQENEDNIDQMHSSQGEVNYLIMQRMYQLETKLQNVSNELKEKEKQVNELKNNNQPYNSVFTENDETELDYDAFKKKMDEKNNALPKAKTQELLNSAEKTKEKKTQNQETQTDNNTQKLHEPLTLNFGNTIHSSAHSEGGENTNNNKKDNDEIDFNPKEILPSRPHDNNISQDLDASAFQDYKNEDFVSDDHEEIGSLIANMEQKKDDSLFNSQEKQVLQKSNINFNLEQDKNLVKNYDSVSHISIPSNVYGKEGLKQLNKNDIKNRNISYEIQHNDHKELQKSKKNGSKDNLNISTPNLKQSAFQNKSFQDNKNINKSNQSLRDKSKISNENTSIKNGKSILGSFEIVNSFPKLNESYKSNKLHNSSFEN